MFASVLLKNTVGRKYFREIKKLCTLKKKLFLEIKYSNLQGKNIFLGTTTLLWITIFSYELLFQQNFCTSVSNSSSMLFQHL